MSNEKIVSPLTTGDLERAAYLCLAAAATTNLDGLFGDSRHRMHNERKRRFERARTLVESGVTSLQELGLSHIDCAWAAGKAELAKDKEGWLSRFQMAEGELRKVLQKQVEEIINEPQHAQT